MRKGIAIGAVLAALAGSAVFAAEPQSTAARSPEAGVVARPLAASRRGSADARQGSEPPGGRRM